MNDQPSINVKDMNFWDHHRAMFEFLDLVSPTRGAKFQCSVCTGERWGSQMVWINDNGEPKEVIPVVNIPTLKSKDEPVKFNDGTPMPGYFYTLQCATCSNTLFFNASVVQYRLMQARALSNGKG